MNASGHLRPLILCVDDKVSESQLDLFARVLEVSGYAVLTASGAFEALEMFRRNQVDLVLTEHILVAHAGRTLAANMKRLKPAVPVAIYSADLVESPEDMRFADAFITKLVSIEELLSSIQKLLQKVPVAMGA